MTLQFGIVADDLTGACDTALEFFNNGYSAVVRFSDRGAAASAEVISVNTDSRQQSAEKAYTRTRIAIQQLQATGTRTIYKKIDSALRGNIGIELQALYDTGRVEAIVMAPALPIVGRTVKQGIVKVNGQPLASSAIGREYQRLTSNAAEIIAETTHLPVSNIALELVRAEKSRFAHSLKTAVAQGARVLIVDALDDADLNTIAALLAEHPHWCGAGSAGLAGAIARQFPFSRITPPEGIFGTSALPVLGVIGSQHPTARIQLDWLERQRQAQIVRFKTNGKQQMTRVKQEVQEKLCRGQSVVLTGELGDECNVRRAQAMARDMGEIVAGIESRFAGLVLCGGDTAQGVLSALGAQTAHIIARVEPGMPLLVLNDGRYPNMRVVTKAGSFGNPASLGAAFEFIQRI